jgi:hypothetical protein
MGSAGVASSSSDVAISGKFLLFVFGFSIFDLLSIRFHLNSFISWIQIMNSRSESQLLICFVLFC